MTIRYKRNWTHRAVTAAACLRDGWSMEEVAFWLQLDVLLPPEGPTGASCEVGT